MLKKAGIKLILFYQGFIRPYLACSCRFFPSCSDYTMQAIDKYGFVKGSLKGIKRLMSCHPFSRKTGFDPLI
ncbi:MAG: membrane protein insertion efficiency factor YidD [Candidatus Omnitrophica bacterium]|nr:membrane protein insertion efficiency factor YidD [Candidatus Omnitrophota bacterium]